MCRWFDPGYHHSQVKTLRNEGLFVYMEMYYVYILESLKSKLHYTGIAKDVEVRLRDHNRGKKE